MKKIILNIEGMTCSACSNGLEKYLNKQKDIHSATVNLVLATASIEYADTLTIEDINSFIEEAGFKSLGEVSLKKKNPKKKQTTFIIFTILTIILMYISMGHMVHLPIPTVLNMHTYPLNYAIFLCLLTIPFFLYGFDILKSGIKNLLHKTPNMDTLVTFGVLTSFIYSFYNLISIFVGNTNAVHNLYFESCATIIYFIKLGRLIENKNKEKTTQAIEELVQITPSTALLKTKSGEKEITIDEIKKGDILIAKPGMKIACDGTITKGKTHIEEAFLTGESLPVKKEENAKILAGSINIDGYIEYQAEKIGKNSSISEIVQLVIDATNTKAPIARLADKVSGYFVPTIIIIAILTFLGYLVFGFSMEEAITSFVSVLVIACPCALGLATPLAIVVSEGLCARAGILVKSSATLESAHKIDTIVFDKTGTLTVGNLEISKILNYSSYKEKELLEFICNIEEKSNHPIANTFIKYKKNQKLKDKEVTNFLEYSGIGISATIEDKDFFLGNNKLFKKLKIKNNYEKEESALTSYGNSIVYVIENKKVVGLIGIKDVVRNDALQTIKTLKKQKIDVRMLTGDNERTAHIVALSLGINNVKSNCLPKEKTKYIKELMASNKKVMMIGDGINDAPSLGAANIGVSLNSGTDIAANSADVLLINDHLESIISLIEISKKTFKIIKQNLFWAFFYNLCMIPIAIGLLKPFSISINPMIASFAMMMSSLTVVFNTLRLLK